MAKVREGDRAPDFELEGTGSRTYRLADYRGEGLILAFYPGDFTPVCTKQFCSYRDDGDRIEALGVPMLGISPQTVESHERFAAEHGLTVPAARRPRQASRPRLRGRSAPAASCAARSSWSTREGIVRYRHVALFGLRYQDVGTTSSAPSSGRLSSVRDGREPRADAVRGRPSGPRLAGESGGGGAADRAPARGHRDPPLRRPRLQGPGAAGLPPDLLRRPRPRRVGPRPRRTRDTPTAELVADLGAVLESAGGARPLVLAATRWAATRSLAYALGHRERARGRWS